MTTNILVTKSIEINAPIEKVWNALTDPKLIKQYLFGTDVKTDWKKGSPITYLGVWQGKPYEDKGKIIKIQPKQELITTYWSSLGGLPDKPENYKRVKYTLFPTKDGTLLKLSQDNNNSQEEAEHAGNNWMIVLNTMKKILENV